MHILSSINFLHLLKVKLLRAALEENSPAAIRRALHEVVPTFHEPEEVNRVQGKEVEVPSRASAKIG